MSERLGPARLTRRRALFGAAVLGGAGAVGGIAAAVDGVRRYYGIRDRVREQLPSLTPGSGATAEQIAEREEAYRREVRQQPGYDSSLNQTLIGEGVAFTLVAGAGLALYKAVNSSDASEENVSTSPALQGQKA